MCTPNATEMGQNAGCRIHFEASSSNETVSRWITILNYNNVAAEISHDTTQVLIPETLQRPQWSQTLLYYIGAG